MADRKLRELEREWRQTRQPAAGRRYLQALERSGARASTILSLRLEVGDLDAWRVRLAAWMGHEPCRETLGWGEQDSDDLNAELAEALPAWFWACVDMAHPDERRLIDNLRRAPPHMVALYQLLIESAAEAVCDYWDGPTAPELQTALSEDSAEEFAKWVVCQGQALWRAATARDADLSALVTRWLAADRDPSLARSDAAASVVWRLDTVDDAFREGLQERYQEMENDPGFLLQRSAAAP